MQLSEKLTWKTWGHPSKPILVFLHGFLGCKEDWNDLAVLLSPDYFCVACDLPGHGKSNFFEDFISHLIKQLQGTSFTLIGYSMGGRLAMLLRDHLPHLDRVIYLSTNTMGNTHDPSDSLRTLPIIDFLRSWYSSDLFCTLDITPAFLAKRSEQNIEGLIQMFHAMQQPLPTKASIPEFFLYGEKDTKYATMFQETGIQIPNASHAIHLEAAGWLNDFIRRTVCKRSNK